jgi:hypothetical protein
MSNSIDGVRWRRRLCDGVQQNIGRSSVSGAHLRQRSERTGPAGGTTAPLSFLPNSLRRSANGLDPLSALNIDILVKVIAALKRGDGLRLGFSDARSDKTKHHRHRRRRHRWICRM